MIVSDVMRTQVFFVSPDATVREAAIDVIAHDVESALVKDDSGKVVGIVSERDFLQAVLPDISELMAAGSLRSFNDVLELCREHGKTKVEDVMTRGLHTVAHDSTLVKALGAMLAERHRRLPVLKDGEVVGILTQTDLMRQIYMFA